jgi:glycosyltransferase involved in cell wall biosynthesis
MFINFFPPSAGGGVYRPLSFVKYLSRSSWDITVVTPMPGEFWINDPELVSQVPDDVQVVRTSSLSGLRILNSIKGGSGSRRSSAGFGILRRVSDYFLIPDTYIGWIPFAVRAGKRLCREREFDIVYSTSPPDSSHLAARSIARSFGVPWIADFRDPWISLYYTRTPTALHQRWHRHLERSVMMADRLLVVTEWHRLELLRLYPEARVEKVPNGYDEEDFEGLEDERPEQDLFTVLHTGMLTLGRTAEPFLRGLQRFLDNRPEAKDRVRVCFVGSRESRNEDCARRLGLQDLVCFEDNISHSECIRRERRSHVLLLLKHDDDRYRGAIPGKLYEYFGARRPILCVAGEGEGNEMVATHRRGEVADIDDPEDIALKLAKMYDLFLDGGLDSAYSLEESKGYTRRLAAQKLDGIMRSLLEDR